MNQKQMKLNLVCTIVAFLISLGLNFYITPLIGSEMGDAAYGFVSMANDFVSYAALVSSVLNSVASRFIALEIHHDNLEKANKYYSSVFVANVLLAIILLMIGVVFTGKVEYIFDVPMGMLSEVRWTFLLTFINYIVVLTSSVFTVCTYVTNRLDIAGVRNAISYLLKFIVVLLLVGFTQIHMYYVAIATIISSLFLGLANIRLTKKLVPELSLNVRNFETSYIKTLAVSGIWMAISNLSQILMTGLDSVITNKMIGADAMGVLGISRTIPNALILAISTIGVIFTPNFVELYAKGKREKLITACKQSVRVMGLVLGVPTVGIIVFGSSFYSLWLPYKSKEEIVVVQILSILMMMQSVFNMLTISLAQLSVVTDKLRTPVFVSLALGVVNVICVILLVKYTNLGIYAVAGVSSVLFSIRYLIFNPIYAAYTLKAKWYTFYGTIFKMLIPLFVLGIGYYWVQKNYLFNTWKSFILVVFAVGIAGYIFVFFTCEYTRIIAKIRRVKGKQND